MVSFKFTSSIVIATTFATRAACLAVDVVPSQLVSSYGMDDLLPDILDLSKALKSADEVIIKLGTYRPSLAATKFNEGYDAIISAINKAMVDIKASSESSLPSELFAQLPLRENVDTIHKVIDDAIKQKSIIMGHPSIASEFPAMIKKFKNLINTFMNRMFFIVNSPADKYTLLKYLGEINKDIYRLDQVFH